jgi:hypothetical protein
LELIEVPQIPILAHDAHNNVYFHFLLTKKDQRGNIVASSAFFAKRKDPRIFKVMIWNTLLQI